MPLFNPQEGSAIKYQYNNSEIPAGNTVASSLVLNPETTFASSGSIPSNVFAPGQIVRIYVAGVYGSGLLSLPLTLKVKSGSNTLASVAFTPILNLANKGWSIELFCNVFNLATVEIQGTATFAGTGSTSNVMPVGNSSSFSVNMNNDVPISFTAQWGALAVGGTIQLRIFSIQVT